MKNLFSIFACILFFTNSITPSNLRTALTRGATNLQRSFSSTSDKEKAIQALRNLMDNIARKDPANLYIACAKEALRNGKPSKATSFVNAHFCNEMYLELEKLRKEEKDKDKKPQS